MTSSSRPRDRWQPCPEGPVQQMVRTLQSRRRAVLLHNGGIAAAFLTVAVFAGVYGYARNGNHGPSYGGIDCRGVMESARAYVDGSLDPDRTDRIRQHLVSCNACRSRIDAVRRRALEEAPCDGRPGCDPENPSSALTFGSLRQRSDDCE